MGIGQRNREIGRRGGRGFALDHLARIGRRLDMFMSEFGQRPGRAAEGESQDERGDPGAQRAGAGACRLLA